MIVFELRSELSRNVLSYVLSTEHSECGTVSLAMVLVKLDILCVSTPCLVEWWSEAERRLPPTAAATRPAPHWATPALDNRSASGSVSHPLGVTVTFYVSASSSFVLIPCVLTVSGYYISPGLS